MRPEARNQSDSATTEITDSNAGIPSVVSSNPASPKVPAVKGYPVARIIERIANGELVPEIAEDIGCTHAAIVYACNQHDPQQYQAARLTRSEVRLDKAEHGIQVAVDGLSLARARELFNAVRWRAEREHPDRWGQRQTIVHEDLSDLGERLRRARGRTIDATDTSDPV